ncbi:MAG: hypothetical protein HY558_06135 [Euryarchaeota archaeon]|nr:hypothetical protein [Euryarchaeota archaeon]
MRYERGKGGRDGSRALLPPEVAPGTIAHGAHLGGLFVGVAYGLLLRPGQRGQSNLFDSA